MPRYFLEVSYRGDRYSGFQVQENANSVQEEVEKAFAVYFRKQVGMTGASRTDTGVHARQNFFHFDLDEEISRKVVYNLNALLPEDISVNELYLARADAHCRFDAVYREYRYHIYQQKDPFQTGRACYYPFPLDLEKLEAAASLVLRHTDFSSFSKRNTQAKTSLCTIERSCWKRVDTGFVYEVKANRFLRGMVRGLVGTMLHVGRGKMGVEEFRAIIEGGDQTKVDFSVPGHGLYLVSVGYSEGLPGTPVS